MHTVTLKGRAMSAKKGRLPRLRKDGTWVDRSTPGDRELIARGKLLELAAQQAEIEAKRAARRHYLRMQVWVLIGALATIVGAFFGVGANLNPNSHEGGKGFQIGRRRRRK